ncbi:MAG: helix-turn-helix transcriptional regulator [Oscillospiraceae bacterium]|nr:helix-turn-helix transcriptional regulator [Oscillospiraceae bacterium]
MTNFNKTICINNIYLLAKRRKEKIGKIEEVGRVSKGYLSKLMKDEKNTTPSIEFIVLIANYLEIDINTLISCDLSELTPSEIKLLNFLDRLLKKTYEDKIVWNKHSSQEFEEPIDSNTNDRHLHPLSQPITNALSNNKYRGEFKSLFCVNETVEPTEYYYSYDFNETSILFVPVKKASSIEIENNIIFEMYAIKDNKASELYSSALSNPTLNDKLNCLYKAITNSLLHVHLNKDTMDIIDNFMLYTET